MATIALGADHAGYSLKEKLKTWLAADGHRVIDHGTHSTDSVDYPDYAAAVAETVRAGEAERGLDIERLVAAGADGAALETFAFPTAGAAAVS